MNAPQTIPAVAPILVVDDEEATWRFLTRCLGLKGFVVFAADSAEKAIEMWKQMNPKPQLLITDLRMPGMGGKEFAAAMRQLQPDLKVLFISGFGPETIEEARRTIANSYGITKPFSVDQLTSTVEAALAQA
jgi:two-component system cell cycle sensor histidine kinase/response regulator CckA